MRRHHWLALLLFGLGLAALGYFGNSRHTPSNRGQQVAPTPEANHPFPSLEGETHETDWVQLPCDRERFGYDLLLILSEPHVQAALELTPAQQAAIAAQADTFLHRAAAQHTSAPLGVGAPTELSSEYGRAALAAILPRQKRRLDQVLFQLASLDVHSIPEIAQALGASPEQQEAFLKIRQEAGPRLADLRLQWKAGNLSREAYENSVHRALVAGEEAIDRLLDARQQALMHAWRGPRIDFGRMHLRLGIQSPRAASNARSWEPTG